MTPGLPALEFIESMPNGFEREVGERGGFLSAGNVVESGTHHEFLANGGLYRDFHRKQFASAEIG